MSPQPKGTALAAREQAVLSWPYLDSLTSSATGFILLEASVGLCFSPGLTSHLIKDPHGGGPQPPTKQRNST